MQERFSELRNKEVINLPDGCRLGYTGDLMLDPDSGQILALVVPACDKLLGMLPQELQSAYDELLRPVDEEVEQLIKAADKLSAWIKCIEELKAGNLEFRAAADQTEKALDGYGLPEVAYFKEHFMPSFRLTLDELE